MMLSFSSQHMYIILKAIEIYCIAHCQLERAETKLKVNNLLQCNRLHSKVCTIVRNVFSGAPIKRGKITMNKFSTVKIFAVSISIGLVWLGSDRFVVVPRNLFGKFQDSVCPAM